MIALFRCHMIALLVGAAVLSYPAGAAGARSLSADLSLIFICRDQDRVSIEDRFETFLRGNAFKVLNLARLQQEHQVFILKTRIKSLDAKLRMIDLTSFPLKPDVYALNLNTPPPTQRDAKLEDAILKFVSDTLKCDVREVSRAQNGSDASDLHEREVKRLEGLFVEAERLRGGRRL